MVKRAFIVWAIILVTITLFKPAYGQFIDNRLHLFAGVHTGNISADALAVEQSLIFPGFYHGFQKARGVNLSPSYAWRPWMWLGLNLNYMQSREWEMEISDHYNRTVVHHYTLSPAIRIATPMADTGILNRLSFYAELFAGAGFTEIRQRYPRMEIIGPPGTVIVQQLEEPTFLFSYGVRTGLTYILYPSIGIYLGHAYCQNQTSAILHMDKQFSNSKLEFGVFYRLFQNKRFYY